MTPRDIFLKTLNFQPESRLPRVEWAAWWDKTIARWENEGLPKGLSFEDSLRYFGLDVMQCLMAQAGKASIHNEEEYEAVRGELYTDRLIDTVVENARRLLPAQERGGVSSGCSWTGSSGIRGICWASRIICMRFMISRICCIGSTTICWSMNCGCSIGCWT